jgi:hypothetical protein
VLFEGGRGMRVLTRDFFKCSRNFRDVPQCSIQLQLVLSYRADDLGACTQCHNIRIERDTWM